MVDLEYWKEKAASCGFTHVGELDVDTIELRQEARDACAENKCHSYGKNWSCPPGCGTLEECDARIRKYKKGVLVQTTGEVDSLDFESFMELGRTTPRISRNSPPWSGRSCRGPCSSGSPPAKTAPNAPIPTRPAASRTSSPTPWRAWG